MFKLIAFTGPKYSGKSTAATVTRTILHGQRRSFAEPIYQIVSMLTNLDVTQLHSKRYKEKKIPGLNSTPRHLLQTLGTEWGRNLVDPNIWLGPMHVIIKAAMSLDLAIVIDDLRFPNEAEFVHDHGGLVIKILPAYPCYVTSNDTHLSEVPLPLKHIDHTLNNTKELEVYKKDIATLLSII